MKRKLRNIIRRFGAGAMAFALGASLGLAAAPPLEARAAGGTLTVTLVDAETRKGWGQGLTSASTTCPGWTTGTTSTRTSPCSARTTSR